MAQWCCTRRALISTSNGYLSLAPKATQVGDTVCVLLVCTNPLILRQIGNIYEIAGECYVDSMMHEEAFLGQLPEGVSHISKFDEDLGYSRQAFWDQRTNEMQFVNPRYSLFLGDNYEKFLDLGRCGDDAGEKLVKVLVARGIKLDVFVIV
ncbi:hypothetical protein BGZ60DRAFT_535698 [Tricladium varicosporioides]|nr:hypothetical protein BGZ60DRAFT_535698 [Hymenoscyphus varicosporioides]